MKTVNIIWGACQQGIIIRDYLQRNNYAVDYFIDRDVDKQGDLNGTKVISPNDFFAIEYGQNLKIYICSSSVSEIVSQIRNHKFNGDIYGVRKEILNDGTAFADIFYKLDLNKPMLNYVEYEVSRHCNLKCKGCTHFSNIQKEPVFGDVDIFYKDITRLKELFSNVQRIRLLGGEPLLNPQFSEFYRIAREAFPIARIEIVTNGILILSVEDNIFDEMNRLGIEFDITQYPPTSKLIDKITHKLNDHEVKYCISNKVEVFFDRNNYLGDSNVEESYRDCTSKGCHFMYNGKIALCPRPFVFERVKDEYGIQDEVLNEDMIDIYSDEIDGEYIIKKLLQPAGTCRYCVPQNKLKYFKWEIDN